MHIRGHRERASLRHVVVHLFVHHVVTPSAVQRADECVEHTRCWRDVVLVLGFSVHFGCHNGCACVGAHAQNVGHRRRVRGDPARTHGLVILERLFVISTSIQSPNERRKRHAIDWHSLRAHEIKRIYSALTICTLFARRQHRVERNRIRFNPVRRHEIENFNRLVRSSSLYARRNRRRIRNLINFDFGMIIHQVLKHLHRAFVPLRLGARAHQRRVGENISRNVPLLHIGENGKRLIALLRLA
mmetsp:Transcript_7446/g.27173  ORF Transcript_7446/g.27173 Transcript_7446/m.27173 type:complete len:244 (-) Transcript_7446:791-1522(-)